VDGTGEELAEVWYADDGTLAVGDAAWPAADDYLRCLASRLAEVGLSVVPSAAGRIKSCVVLSAPVAADVESGVWRLPEWPRRFCAPVLSARALGVPVAATADGWDEVRGAVRRQLEEAAAVVSGTIPRLVAGEYALHALSMAGTWSRVEYVLSLAPEPVLPHPGALAALEAADMSVLAGVLGAHAAALTVQGWLQACQPVRAGGLGLRSVAAELPWRRWQTAARVARAEGLPEHGPPPVRPPEDVGASWLAAMSGELDAARVADMRSGGAVAGEWLRQVPPPSDLAPPGVFATAVALRIGIDVFPRRPDAGTASCPGPCATRGVLDPQGVHALGCTAVRCLRHAQVTRALAASLQALAGSGDVAQEVACGPDGDPRLATRGGAADTGTAEGGTAPRPGDVAVRRPGALGGCWQYLDVTVVSMRADVLRRAAAGDGHALHGAAYAEKERTSAGAAGVRAAGQHFAPIAMSAYGSMDPRSVRLLSGLAGGLQRDAAARGRAHVPGYSSMVDGTGGQPVARRVVREVVRACVMGGARGVNRLREEAGYPPAGTRYPCRAAELAVGVAAAVAAAGA
jgi:hypothetical protein